MIDATTDVLVRVRNLRVDYQVREGLIKSCDNVSFDIEKGKVTAMIGESGSGKSTLSNAILGLLPPNGKIAPGSEVLFEGQNMLQMGAEKMRQFRWRKASLVFQAAQNALNPTVRIQEQLLDTVDDHGDNPRREPYPERLARLLSMVRLSPSRVLNAYPHELSGGMRQRVIIAMALMLQPELVILDEPTTALDVITQSYIFDILQDIHRETQLTMVFITHDLAAVARLADRIGVMYAGKMVELAPADVLFKSSRHPYTRGLFGSLPSIEGDTVQRRPIAGQPPDLIHKPAGCVFNPRCSYAIDRCRTEEPAFEPIASGHQVACHRWKEVE